MTENARTVLIIDDDIKMANELVETFERYNTDELRLPADLEISQGIFFKPDYCQDPLVLSKKLQDIPKWDVFVVDRMFGNTTSPKNDKVISILKSLQDLSVNSVKIIWTAFPDENGYNLIECMRLGAWDYIIKDKKDEQYNVGAMMQVVLSALRGLRTKEIREQKVITDREGHQFVVDHYAEIFSENKGYFVAFEKLDKTWNQDPIAKSRSLYDLYERIKEQGKDINSLHITLIRE